MKIEPSDTAKTHQTHGLWEELLSVEEEQLRGVANYTLREKCMIAEW